MLRTTGFILYLFLAGAVWAAGAEGPSAFRSRLLRESTRVPGFSVGVAIKDLRSGEEFLVNPDAEFPQGSTIRIHLVTELYRQAAGRLSVDEVRPLPEAARTGGFGVLRHLGHGTVSLSLRDYAALMMMVNDNTAANFLTDVLGMDNVNASLAAQGTPEIRFRRKAVSRRDAPADLPENTGTPRAAMRALELVHRGAVVDANVSSAILEVLALPESSWFRRDLPSGVRFAGESSAGRDMRCEEGIVLLPGRPYIFCVMYTRPPGTDRPEAAEDPLERIARLALEHFGGPQAVRVRGR